EPGSQSRCRLCQRYEAVCQSITRSPAALAAVILAGTLTTRTLTAYPARFLRLPGLLQANRNRLCPRLDHGTCLAAGVQGAVLEAVHLVPHAGALCRLARLP